MYASQNIFPVSERKNLEYLDLRAISFNYGDVSGNLYHVSFDVYLKAINALEAAEHEICKLTGIIEQATLQKTQ
jgi:hypothetical protein